MTRRKWGALQETILEGDTVGSRSVLDASRGGTERSALLLPSFGCKPHASNGCHQKLDAIVP